MENEVIIQKLNRIEKYIFALKGVLNLNELVDYTGFSKSYVYQLVHRNEITYSNPNGGMLFFNRKEIDEWLLSNRFKSDSEITEQAFKHLKNLK